MARVLALIPDLMFGSKVQAALAQAGHAVTLAATVERAAAEAPDADVLIADLASGELDPGEVIAVLGTSPPRTLACFAHVEPAAREAALGAGFDLVVPRSRLHREGPELVARLLES